MHGTSWSQGMAHRESKQQQRLTTLQHVVGEINMHDCDEQFKQTSFLVVKTQHLQSFSMQQHTEVSVHPQISGHVQIIEDMEQQQAETGIKLSILAALEESAVPESLSMDATAIGALLSMCDMSNLLDNTMCD